MHDDLVLHLVPLRKLSPRETLCEGDILWLQYVCVCVCLGKAMNNIQRKPSYECLSKFFHFFGMVKEQTLLVNSPHIC